MKVSIVIPCYNVQDYISECIISALDQTFRETEIICIDNNSSDNTLSLLEEFREKHPHKIRIASENRPGANYARNKGLSMACGEWVQFLDADDLLMPDKIEHQVALLHGSEGISFIAAASIHRTPNMEERKGELPQDDPFVAPYINRCGNTCANLWNKAALLEVGGWNEDLTSSQETDLMLRLALLEKNYICDHHALTIIRERATGQISQGNPAERLKRYITIRMEYLTRLRIAFPDHYKNNLPLFYDFLVVTILELAKYDPSSANYFFNSGIRQNWSTGRYYGMNTFKRFLLRSFGVNMYSKFC